jgi:alkanesulfonate monooxygenase SsuD/methylene tetrahydromethanopterin reductase-like flavin-dependent oxidoreductase (luciferase family)
VRFGILLPNVGEFASPRTSVDLAVAAEDAGWDGVFLWDMLSLSFDEEPWPAADPWIAMAAIAQVTERISFGPMVTPLARRRPAKVARETVTLDHLSQGRLILGVGLGGAGGEFDDYGEDPDPKVRASKLDESLEVLVRLWSGEPVTHSGSHYEIRDRVFLPTPLRSARIPVWVGGYWPNKAPARRAARWDGMFLIDEGWPDGFLRPDEIAAAVSYVGEHRAPDAGAFDVVAMGTLDGRQPRFDAGTMRGYEEAGATWWLAQADDVAAVRALIARGHP